MLIAQAAGEAPPRIEVSSEPLPLRPVLRLLRRVTPAARELVSRVLDTLGVEE